MFQRFNQPAADTVIGVWRSTGMSWQDYLEQAVKYGYQIVLSTPWYLNYIDYGQDWIKVCIEIARVSLIENRMFDSVRHCVFDIISL